MTNKTKNAHTWLTGLLTGWGIKESWAKVLAGAIIGAAIAAGVLTLHGCSVEYSQTAEGVRYHGCIVPVERSSGK
jgi:hypothetical protein